eukprot:jgi/Botrbrau1/1232/Bobra.0163s0031.7
MTSGESVDLGAYTMLSDLGSTDMAWGKSMGALDQTQMSDRDLRRFLLSSKQPDISAFLASAQEPSLEHNRIPIEGWGMSHLMQPPGTMKMDGGTVMGHGSPHQEHMQCLPSEPYTQTPPNTRIICTRAHPACDARDMHRSDFSTPSPSGNEEEDDEARSLREAERRAKRRKSNRDSARNTRLRKSKELHELRLQYNEVAQKNVRLQEQVQELVQTNEVLLGSVPNMGVRYREVQNENSKLRNMVERLRYHLVNQLAVTGHPVTAGLPDDDLDGPLQSALGNPFESTLQSSLHTSLDSL